MKAEAEIGVMQTQAKEQHLETAEAGRGREGFFPRALEGTWLCRHLDFRLLASITVRE